MKCIWKKLFIFLLLMSISLWMPCQVRAGEISGEIEVLINNNEAEMQKYKEAFEKKYPNVTVRYTTYHDYENEVRERIQTGDYGDVLYVPSFWVNEVYGEYLEPLGSIEELSEKYDFLEKGWVRDGVIYGIPSYAYLNGIVYNTEVFDKAGITEIPKTIDEFYKDMELIKKHTDAIPFYTNCSVDWALYPWLSFPYIEMTGNASYKLNDFVYQENPFSEGSNHYKVYELLYNLAAGGYVEENVMDCTWDSACKMLNNGEIGCIAIGSWAINQIRNAGENGQNIAFMPFPNNIGGKQYLTAVMDFSYGVSSRSKNKEAAKAYVTFMLEESGYVLDYENISLFKADLYPKSFQELGDIEVMVEVANYGRDWGFFQTLSQDLSLNDVSEIQRIIKAGAGIQAESFEEIMQEWNRRWEKNRTAEMKKPDSEENALTMFLNERELQLSVTELEFIHAHPTIKVGYLRYQAPFSMEKDGEFLGVSYEICEEIQTCTGMQMEYIGYDTTKELLQALSANEIDAAACIEKHDVYQEKIRYSREYITCANALIRKGGFSAEVNDSSKATAIYGEEKDYWNHISQVYYCDTLAACIDSVEAEKTDYTIANFYSANYYIRENRNKNISIIPSTAEESMHFAFGEQTDDTLVAIVNKCIYSISESNVHLFVQKYMNVENNDITLKRFVEENAVLCISIVAIVVTVILLLIIMILQEKNRSSQKHAVEMKRYEIVSKLSNEYIFDYEYATDSIRFDAKFAREFSFEENVSCKEDYSKHIELAQILKQLEIIKESQTSITFQMQRSNGEQIWYQMIGFPIKDKNGECIHLIGKLVNVQKEMEEKKTIETKAEIDPLTRLYNREGLQKRVKEYKTPIMLAVLDLDNFKSVNDTLGHAGGDEALKFLAGNLEKVMGTDTILARYGGDEFVIVATQVSENEIRARLQALIKEMDTEITFEGIRKKISISLGAIYCTQENVSMEELFKEADKELYGVKQAGKNGYSMKKWNMI